jgi:hypothetical protein
MSKKKVDNNSPKSLTTSQRLFLDQLIAKFGKNANLVKRSDLLKATKEINGLKFAPSWISKNLKVRIPDKRARYDLTVLLKLPVVAFKDVVIKTKPLKVPKEPVEPEVW